MFLFRPVHALEYGVVSSRHTKSMMKLDLEASGLHHIAILDVVCFHHGGGLNDKKAMDVVNPLLMV